MMEEEDDDDSTAPPVPRLNQDDTDDSDAMNESGTEATPHGGSAKINGTSHPA